MFIVLTVLIVYLFVQNRNLVEENISYLQSQCYTKIQPSDFFESGEYVLQGGNAIISEKAGDNKVIVEEGLKIVGVNPTGSMRPTISDYSILIMSDDISNLRVGDIISYNSTGNLNLVKVHRIIDVKDEKYIVKGDNNEISDIGRVDISQINSKVVGVLY